MLLIPVKMPEMEQNSRAIKLYYTDREINSFLADIKTDETPFTKHYNQSEDFFLKLKSDFSIPHLPIHHDIKKPYPEEHYIKNLRLIIRRIIPLAPSLFRELTYFFDPAEILRPGFFKLYKIEGTHYLYIVRLNLLYRAQDDTVLEKGDNDFNPAYKTNHLFLTANFIPLNSVEVDGGKIKSFLIKETISQTWIGERGRGYFVQGIWMDDDLTKFFSKLFLPPGKRTYPFYPFVCKYKTVCQNVIDFSSSGRRLKLPYLHRTIQFLEPKIKKIQQELKNTDFSEDLDVYKELKEKIPSSWYKPWENIKISVYLNSQDQKEFQIED